MPLIGFQFDEDLAQRFNSHTDTEAWQAYYAGRAHDELVYIEALFAGQPDLCPAKLMRIASTPTPAVIERGTDPIVILRSGDKEMVLDGHHRVAVARMSGWLSVRAKVVTLN